MNRALRLSPVAVLLLLLGLVPALAATATAAPPANQPAAAINTAGAATDATSSRSGRCARSIRALAYPGTASPVMATLRKRLGKRLCVVKANRKRLRHPAAYRVLILDGDRLSSKALRRHRGLARHFLNRGGTVLALDLRGSAHRRAILANAGIDLSSFAGTSGASHGLLIRRDRRQGTRRIMVVEAPGLSAANLQGMSKAERRQVRNGHSRRFAQLAHRHIADRPSRLVRVRQAPRAGASAAGGAMPPELQHIGWTYTKTGTDTPPDAFWKGHTDGAITKPDAGFQISDWTLNHNFDLYLENSVASPQGERQVLAYGFDAAFTPTRSTATFQFMDKDFTIGLGDKRHLSRSWWTSRVRHTVKPEIRSDRDLTWQANAPESPNETTSYTSGNEFTVGFSASKNGPKVNAEYSISNEKEYEIPDWGVENLSSGNQFQWLYSSRQPCEINDSANYTSKDRCFPFADGAVPARPNALSRGQLQLHTSGRWQTPKLLTGGAAAWELDAATTFELADLYCRNFGPYFCTSFGNQAHAYSPQRLNAKVDATMVVPSRISSLDLSPNPADGSKNQPVTGTVTLAQPVKIETEIVVSSNSDNAVLASSGGPGGNSVVITIPTGSKAAKFKLMTNDNGLRSGDHTTAAITAFYTEPTTEQLRIVSPQG